MSGQDAVLKYILTNSGLRETVEVADGTKLVGSEQFSYLAEQTGDYSSALRYVNKLLQRSPKDARFIRYKQALIKNRRTAH
jgi:hypothetical protein